MNIAIIYESVTGNTAQVAEAIRAACGGHRIVAFGGPQEGREADLTFVGYWVDKGMCSDNMAAFCKGLSGKKAAIFGTAGAGGEDYFHRLEERMRAQFAEDTQILGAFYCQGKMPEGVRQGYLARLKENPDDQRAKVGLDNFDRAQAHPNEADLAAAGEFARRITALAEG